MSRTASPGTGLVFDGKPASGGRLELGGLILEGSNPNRGTQAGPGAAQTPESGLGAGYLDLMELVQGHPLAMPTGKQIKHQL